VAVKTLLLAAALFATGAAAAPTTTSIKQGGVPGNYTLTATVASEDGAAITGTVSFLDADDGNSVLGTAQLVPSVTSLGTPLAHSSPVASASALAAGDFNGDGIVDLAVGGAGSTAILLGNGDGTFTAKTTLPFAPGFIVAGRFDAQGTLDLAIANGSTVSIFLGNGDGTFTGGASISLGTAVTGLAVGSFGGTGSDLAITGSGAISVSRGNGNGTFQAPVTTALPGVPGALVAMSFGAAVISPAGNTVTALINAGGGSFVVKPAIASGNNPTGIATADFDGDGIADLAVTNTADGTVTIFIGDGTGAFTAGQTLAAGPAPGSIVPADFNNDGRADLAIVDGGGTITLLLGKGLGGFTPSTLTAPAATALVAADFDKSGNLDLAVTSSSAGTVTALLTQLQRTAIALVEGVAPIGQGVHQAVASYPGDGTHDASVSAPTPLTTIPTVTMVPAHTSFTVARLGDTLTDAIQVNSAGNFSGDVTLSCLVSLDGTSAAAAAPPGCTIDTSVTVSPAAAATATLTITTSAASLRSNPPPSALLLLLFLGLVPKQRRKLMLFALLFAVGTMSACGDNNNNLGSIATTAGSYHVDVVALGNTSAGDFAATTSITVDIPAFQ
jgi:hypothetical protein